MQNISIKRVEKIQKILHTVEDALTQVEDSVKKMEYRGNDAPFPMLKKNCLILKT